MTDLIHVHIQGKGVYETLGMPFVPRKGDILWLGSLTRGRCDIPEVLVSRVEWSMDQQSGEIGVWLTVRRTSRKAADDRLHGLNAVATPPLPRIGPRIDRDRLARALDRVEEAGIERGDFDRLTSWSSEHLAGEIIAADEGSAT